MTYKPWTKDNIRFLKLNAGSKKARTIGRYLRRTEGAVRQKARELRISLDTR